jgi:F-type H+-transporting ATPase subunit epsilon
MASVPQIERPAAARSLTCSVVTPERGLVEEPADFVALPLYDGEIGILPGRAPLVGRLGFGELRIKRGGVTKHFFVDGGFVQVRDNVVSVLTSRANKAEEINVTDTERKLQELIAGEGDLSPEERLKAQDRARVQLRIARGIGGAGRGSVPAREQA